MAFFSTDTRYKTSWYDGWVFANFPDKNSEKTLHLNQAVKKLIAADSAVLDIGCGVGSLVAALSYRCRCVAGVDVSPRMMKYARKHNHSANVEFQLIEKHRRLSDVFDRQFDCSVLKMVLHEMPERERIDLINEAKKISGEMIIVEWLAPQPKNLSGKSTFLIEMMSTREHYKNFKQWHATGGIDGFLDRHGLNIVQEVLFVNGTGKIAKVHW